MTCPSDPRLTAYVDGALAHRDRERTATHLMGCGPCRDRMRDLRGVRDRVRRVAPATGAPSADLAARLVGIAGDGAASPLYARPFDAQVRPATMPSRRRQRQRGLVAGGSAVSALALLLVAIGYVAAPPTRTPAVDPTALALSEFATVLDAEPVSNPAVTAAMAAPPGEVVESAVSPATAEVTSSEGAYARLERAERAADTVAHSGRQLVQVRHLAGFWTSRVDVFAQPGRGVEVAVEAGRPGVVRRALLPDADPAGLTLIGAHHTLTTGDGPLVAGRPSHVVEAYAGDHVAARWWLDRETGVLLWSQTLDRGRVVQSAGYESIMIGAGESSGHLSPRLTMPVAVTSLTIAAVPQLTARGFACPARVGGLERVSVREVDGVLHSTYGNGVEVVSVLETRGALASAPRGTVWDPTVRAYRSRDLPTMLVWQSGDRVFTVVAEAPTERVSAIVAALPHAAPVLRTRTDRLVDGWRHLLGVA